MKGMSATAVMETSEPTLVLGPHGNIHARDVDDKTGCVYSHLHDAVEQYVRGAVCACRALFGVGGWVVGGWVGGCAEQLGSMCVAVGLH